MNKRYYKLINDEQLKKLEDIFKYNRISRNQFIDCYKSGKILVNDKIVGRNYKVKENDEIKLLIENENNDYKPVENELEVIYEDEDILAVNKPFGISMNSNNQISLSNYITYMFLEREIESKIRYLNRLDMGTSGIVVVFKNKYIQGVFENEKIKSQIEKEYIGIVKGKIGEGGIINKPIIRDGIKSEINENGKKSVTEYSPIKINDDYSIVKFVLHTGRTHQIRLHMSSVGHYLIGDELYGEKENYDMYFLQCSKYKIYSREKDRFIDIKCEYPKYFHNIEIELI